MEPLRIYLEIAKRWVFASAVDWPGWSRRGRGEEAAIDTLLSTPHFQGTRTSLGAA